MYTPNSFLVSDQSTLFDWVERWPFGKLITCQRGQLDINSYPFLLDRDNRVLLSHMARANPQWQRLMMADDLAVCFEGPHGYVSPRWYSQPDGVPTWNYLSIQVSGRAELIKTGSEARSVLERLTEISEEHYGDGWQLQELNESVLTQLLKSLVFFRIHIEGITGKAKLSQNRSSMDRVGVIRQLQQQPDSQLQQLAALMKDALRQTRGD
ncbi:MAG: FMN-binding negative transcriptional regulator [Pseudomonadota bacterium]|nr:FMN-binding negative transcriptional regulator [Pseudomonadota bacterium]